MSRVDRRTSSSLCEPIEGTFSLETVSFNSIDGGIRWYFTVAKIFNDRLLFRRRDKKERERGNLKFALVKTITCSRKVITLRRFAKGFEKGGESSVVKQKWKTTSSHDEPVHVARKWSGCRRSKRLEWETRPAFAVLPCVCLFIRKKKIERGNVKTHVVPKVCSLLELVGIYTYNIYILLFRRTTRL